MAEEKQRQMKWLDFQNKCFRQELDVNLLLEQWNLDSVVQCVFRYQRREKDLDFLSIAAD
jgi:hypothetical protein